MDSIAETTVETTTPQVRVRILTTGSREFTDYVLVESTIAAVWREHGGAPLLLVHGAARGADTLVARVAASRPDERSTAEAHPADWDKYRPADDDRKNSAGFIRNQEMVDAGAVVCLAFYRSSARNSGTRDCVRRARKAGIPVREVWQAS